MRLLVTGGAGFIGSNYVRNIVNGSLKGVSEVIILDKLTYAGSLNNLEDLPKDSYRFVHGDICDSDTVNTLLKVCDAVVNFAAESHVDRSIKSAREFINTNIVGTHTLLEACKNQDVERYLQVSTDEVYGSIVQGSWTEESPLLPNSPYSASKASGDLIVRSFNKTFGLPTLITRCTNNYGPFQYPEKVIPLFVTNLIDSLKIPIYGKGNNIRDWLHVDDHCRAIHLVLKRGVVGETYNIGGGRGLSNNELAIMILDQLGKDSKEIEFVADRQGHDLRYSLGFDKIQNDLGYFPLISFEEGIKQTIAWYKAHESWWRPLKNKK